MKIEESELEKYYEKLSEYHENYLKEYGVHLPHLYWGGKLTKGALILIYLFKNYKKPVKKEELTAFIEEYGLKSNDSQQGRHFGQQFGWYVITGRRGDSECEKYGVKSGQYALIDLKNHYPKFSKEKRKIDLSDDEWELIKEEYNYRCATCGSKEGEDNFHYPNTKTKLEKGHLNPDKPLTYGNIIPQCSKCNKPDRNYFVYNKKGRVIKISDPSFVLKSTNKVKKEMLRLLKEELSEE